MAFISSNLSTWIQTFVFIIRGLWAELNQITLNKIIIIIKQNLNNLSKKIK